MRKKLLPFITVLMLALFVGSCSNEDVMPEIDKGATSRTITFTASMPGEDDPATRVSVAEEADRTIALTWEADDKLDLLFVQGTNKFNKSTTVTNITDDGKKASFTIVMPDEITDGEPFNLYGVYGGGEVSTTNPELIELPAIEGTTLNEENVGKKVMLRFAKTVDATGAVGTVNFEHVGFLFTTKIKVTAGSVDDITSVQLVGATSGNETWAYNTTDNYFNLKTGQFTENTNGTNSVSFQNSEKDAANKVLTVRNWFPAHGAAWPALKLKVNDTETTNAKPARTPEVGKAYYIYATYDGTDLEFASKSDVEPADGTKEKPYSVAEAISDVYVDGIVVKDKWIRGFIVGSYNNGSIFGVANASQYNINIADDKATTVEADVINVQLTTTTPEASTKDIRATFNLIDNPGMYKSEVLFKGDIEKYNGLPGLKQTSDFVILSTTPLFQADNTPINFTSSLELTRTITITTNDTQAWTATSSDGSWLTVAPASGTGSGDVTITATENTDTEAGRTATVTLTAIDNAELAPIIIDVTQKAFEASIIVDPATLTFEKEAGSETIAVTANVAWTAESDAAWATISPANGTNDGTITVSVEANTAAEARSAVITITDDDDATTTTVNVTQAGAEEDPVTLLFPGSDFNDWATFTGALSSHGLKDYATESATGGREGSGAMHIKGTLGSSSNDYVFRALVPEGFSAAGKTEITFWIKGTSTGKALSLNVYTTNTAYKCYNLPKGTTSDITLDPTSQNDYSGNINTGEEWIKVTLDISSIVDNINATQGQNLFAIKVGKSGVYDLLVDDIMIK